MRAQDWSAALAIAVVLAGCGASETDSLSPAPGQAGGDGSGGGRGPGAASPSPSGGERGPAPGAPAEPGTLPSNSTAGKDFFAKNLQPILEAKCATCHTAGGAGTPTYIVKGDPSKTYDMVYLNGFAVSASRIVAKGIHAGGAALELSPAEKSTFAEWIAIEVKDGGAKAQTNVLEKFGSCFDRAKFDAIGLGQLRTTRRQTDNNPLNQRENANNCTGCDNAPCRTCHSADDVTGFVLAIGNPLLPADYTFEQTKKLSPPFIRQYVATTPTGDPQFNPGIMNKSTNTVEKGLAYSHPMFRVSPAMQTAMEAFVNDAIAKYVAGTCGR